MFTLVQNVDDSIKLSLSSQRVTQGKLPVIKITLGFCFRHTRQLLTHTLGLTAVMLPVCHHAN